MAKSIWNANNIPNLKGKVIIITGSTSGIGKAGAKILAEKDATLVMAVRNVKKGEAVAEEIKQNYQNAKVDVIKMDLTSLESVKSFADGFINNYDRLDVLINNAGIMMCPYSQTKDNFEIQMGTNHLGHFALTGHLMPLLKQTEGSRVVATSSMAHKMGNIDFSDLNWESRKYKPSKAYSDSKLGNIYFMNYLAEKSKSETNFPVVTAAHPGWTGTDLQRHSGMMRFMNIFFAQSPEMGILPSLRAAFDQDAKPGDYFGPRKMMEMRGYPVKVKTSKLAQVNVNVAKLWEMSEEMTGIKY